MADSNYQSSFAKDITPEQQSQYPNLNPPSSVNGNTTAGSTANGAAGSLETAKNSVYGSMVSAKRCPVVPILAHFQRGKLAVEGKVHQALVSTRGSLMRFRELTATSNHTTNTAPTVSSLSLVTAASASNPLTLHSLAAQNTMSSIQNSETVKNLQNGPVADKARTEAAATQNDFSNLAASKQVPNTPAATGQPLTHYHSFFYSLLSWENPRATAISYVSIVLFIFATRYVPLVRYGLRLTWIVLGVTAAAEIAGKLVFDQGMTSKFRPKKYYTIPRETLESSLEDVEQLINFFVIEVQRILFAENVYKTIAVRICT